MLLVLSVSLAGNFYWLQENKKETGGMETEIIDVIDGDTIVATYKGKEEHVRLLAIDTPERGEPYCEEATESLRQLLMADNGLYLEFGDGKTLTRDKYGRVLAYLFHAPDAKTCLDMALVRAGLARLWKNGAGRYSKEFQDALVDAKANGRGIWAK